MIVLSAIVTVPARAARAVSAVRFSDVVRVEASELPPFHGYGVDRLALLACTHTDRDATTRVRAGRRAPPPACSPIPFQVDERDAEGHWVLDQGPQPNPDNPPGVLDANDLLLFMAEDAGERVARVDLPVQSPAAEIAIRDPLTDTTQWVYLVAYPDSAPRAATNYVSYDPTADRVRGGRVSLGFTDGVPQYLSVIESPGPDANLLDRLKVRARVTLLWGLLRFSRSEDDLSTQFVGWKQGPIRVIRRQRQWVRLGWGIRSPTFGSYTYFYRDCAELPVGLYLNHAPTFFVGNIVVRIILDFRDLTGWSLIVPSVSSPIPIDGTMTARKDALNQLPASWLALRGPQLTLVQTMDVSASLASARRRLFYRETSGATAEPPETVAGEEPGIGYQLDRWEHVGAGAHQLQSVSCAVPTGLDVHDFVHARSVPLEVTTRAVP